MTPSLAARPLPRYHEGLVWLHIPSLWGLVLGDGSNPLKLTQTHWYTWIFPGKLKEVLL